MRTCDLLFGRASFAAGVALTLAATVAQGQMVRVQAQREVEPPDYSTFEIGPLYSSVSWEETVGYRYTTSSGSGTDYLVNNDRGEIKEDGSDFPIISSLTFRNYLMLSRYADVDASFTVSYLYFPMNTSDDEFRFDMAGEGVYGTVSSEFRISPYLYASVYDSLIYRTDYVDTRGKSDNYGGDDYEYLNNTVGGRLNWLLTPDDTLTLSLSRADWWSMDSSYDDQERTEYSEGLTYTHALEEGINVGAESIFTQYLYKDDTRPDTALEDYRLFSRIDPGAGPAWMERSSLSAYVGYSRGYDTSRPDVASGESTTNVVYESSVDESTMTGGVTLETQLRQDLTHRLSYDHGLRDGFNSAFEQTDTVAYALTWKGELTTIQFRSTYESVNPSSDAETDYSDWANGVTWMRELTKRLTLTLASTYWIRNNDVTGEEVGLSAEDTNDYDTWVSRISTAYELTERTTFTTAYEYAERFSDAEDLAYSRHTIEAYLTYRRQF